MGERKKWITRGATKKELRKNTQKFGNNFHTDRGNYSTTRALKPFGHVLHCEIMTTVPLADDDFS
jgi:hypothetical protein